MCPQGYQATRKLFITVTTRNSALTARCEVQTFRTEWSQPYVMFLMVVYIDFWEVWKCFSDYCACRNQANTSEEAILCILIKVKIIEACRCNAYLPNVLHGSHDLWPKAMYTWYKLIVAPKHQKNVGSSGTKLQWKLLSE